MRTIQYTEDNTLIHQQKKPLKATFNYKLRNLDYMNMQIWNVVCPAHFAAGKPVFHVHTAVEHFL